MRQWVLWVEGEEVSWRDCTGEKREARVRLYVFSLLCDVFCSIGVVFPNIKIYNEMEELQNSVIFVVWFQL